MVGISPRFGPLLVALSHGLGMGVSLAADDAGRTVRPNVVFILADDLGWADTTLYGQTRFHRTPNLDRLARRGMTFTRAYSASPLCSPTRSAILTGLSPARIGITVPNGHLPQSILEARPGRSAAPGKKAIPPVSATRLKTDYRTLAEALAEAGYATGHFGKWHLGPPPYSALEQGFDVDLPHWPGPGPAGSYLAPWKFADFHAEPGQHIEDRMAREAVAFMEKHRDKPFYLNYWMFSVHAPFDAKPAVVAEYRGRVDPKAPQRSPTYAAMVEAMDDAVGTLLDALDRLGIADHTYIVFTSDNGGNMYNRVDGTTPTSNAPLRGGKATLFEGGVRVPCVVAGPGIKAGSRNDTVIQSEDYYPTLLEALGLPPAPGQRFDGASLLRAWRGETFDRGPVFHYFPHDPPVPDWLPPAVSVHRGDWKLIRVFHGGDDGSHRHLLFNLRDDLSERHDLAAQRPELVAELDALITSFLTRTGAVVPTPNPAFDPARYHPELEGKPGLLGAAAKKAVADASDPKLQGWKARGCEATVDGGVVSVRGLGSTTPFLGVGAATDGPARVSLRARAAGGGPGKVEWLAPGTPPGPAHARAFTLAPGTDWRTITVEAPSNGPLGILRVYLPAQRQSVEVDWIELKGPTRTRRWTF